MKTQFDETKRMQLLKGSEVTCTNDVINDNPFIPGEKITYFIAGCKYLVPFANHIMDSSGQTHTFDIGVFTRHFKELSNSQKTH